MEDLEPQTSWIVCDELCAKRTHTAVYITEAVATTKPTTTSAHGPPDGESCLPCADQPFGSVCGTPAWPSVELCQNVTFLQRHFLSVVGGVHVRLGVLRVRQQVDANLGLLLFPHTYLHDLHWPTDGKGRRRPW